MKKQNRLLFFVLFIGVFGIINTEMGIIGILPSIAEHFNVSVTQAGLLVSLFALAVSISGPILPLLFSGMNRYWITSAAPEAPEFANGLFLAFGNLGVTIGTTIGGLFISGIGTRYVVWSGILFLLLSFVFILLRNFMYRPQKQVST